MVIYIRPVKQNQKLLKLNSSSYKLRANFYHHNTVGHTLEGSGKNASQLWTQKNKCPLFIKRFSSITNTSLSNWVENFSMSVIHMQSCLHSDSPPAKSSPLCNWKRETFGTKRQEGTWHCHLMVGAVNQSRGHLGSFLLLSDVGYSIHYCNLRAVAFFRAEEMHRHVTVNKHQRFKTCKTHICFPYILPLSLTIKHLREQNFHVKKNQPTIILKVRQNHEPM